MANWHILGVGAIGSLWACYLHKAGHHVELLFKNRAALDRYRDAGGLTLVRPDTSETLHLDAGINGAYQTLVENLLITTKAHQTLAALEDCIPPCAHDCRLLLLQNGMGVAKRITERFPAQVLYCGVTTDGAYCPEPCTVVHAGMGRTDVGAFRHPGDPRLIIDQLPVSYLDITPCGDIEARQWQKLAINCAINGLTVIYHCRNGVLLERGEARARIGMLCDEIEQVGTASGYGTWVADLFNKVETVLRATAGNFNSMYQDIEHRRRTEIDYLNGYLLQQAQRLGIECPENEKLYEEVKRREETFT
jgi:2-dehydropantoate 2-reductase